MGGGRVAQGALKWNQGGQVLLVQEVSPQPTWSNVGTIVPGPALNIGPMCCPEEGPFGSTPGQNTREVLCVGGLLPPIPAWYLVWVVKGSTPCFRAPLSITGT